MKYPPEARSLFNREQARLVDQIAIEKYNIPGLLLMENAGRSCAELLLTQYPRQVVICCGHGNNGGDGLVIARHLNLANIPVKILLAVEPFKFQGDAAANWNIIKQTNLKVNPYQANDPHSNKILEQADWIVDALLGTGAIGKPRSPYDSLIQQVNQSQAKVLAIDLPSGLDCDLGVTSDVVIEADITATFVASKTGFQSDAAKEKLGQLKIIDIGTPTCMLEEFFSV